MRVRVLVVVVAALVAGCSGPGETDEQRAEREMRDVLAEYQPRFAQRRVALAAAAEQVRADSADPASCERALDPAPVFLGHDDRDLVMNSYNSPEQGGNVDAVPLHQAAVPEQIADRPTGGTEPFAVAPGRLVRGMWITGPQGPLGTNRFPVTARYGDEPYRGAEHDPVRRLRKILDVGLHKRYVALYRVTGERHPEPGATDPRDTVTADVFLADLERGDVPCRFVATGHDYDLAGVDISVHSATPYEDLRTTFQLDIAERLRTLPAH